MKKQAEPFLSPKKITLYALLIAAAFAISFFESRLPSAFIPLPGVKLGLSNSVTLFVLYTLGAAPALFVLVCRCLLAATFQGSLVSLAFSLCGGALAFITMFFAKKLKSLSVIGVSIAGAAAHVTGQIIAAGFIFSSLSVINYLPLLLLSSVFTGGFTGFISAILIKRLQKYV